MLGVYDVALDFMLQISVLIRLSRSVLKALVRYWLLLKIIVSTTTYLVTSKGELLIVYKY